jgi:predicted SAM-dependent methyltransferase
MTVRRKREVVPSIGDEVDGLRRGSVCWGMSLALQARSLGANLKLQLGCGANPLPGWLNTDLMPGPTVDYLDCTRPLPIADNVLAAVFCEHLIEHVDKGQAVAMVGQIFRVLRAGGLFRVVTPSLENFARMALEPDWPDAQTYLNWFRRWHRKPDADISDVANMIFYGYGHRHVYRRAELAAMLQGAGFTDLKFMRASTYGDPTFDGVDGHGKIVGEDINGIEAFAIEARKP